ncbi:transketolase [Pseudopelagicola sp. nBUS_20]|uniref:transketolase n=1 Tax=Pseudopelagicola sp. nBUS_20 TaxID=3395317 RepID=UPI003EB69B7A
MIENQFEAQCLSVRKSIVKTAYECGESTHIGGSLSMVEALVTLFGEFLTHNPADPNWGARDFFILSKGHCVLGYLAVLNNFNYFTDSKLQTFQSNGSDFIAHPVKNTQLGIESSNGSLGQGLSYGLGVAIGFRKRKEDRKVFVLLGDGECNEGSVWETAALAVELEANNLVAIIDENRFRNDGVTTTYESKIKLSNIWRAFGWNVIEVDGHNHSQLQKAFSNAAQEVNVPTAIVAKTVKGRGISFMEENNDWHHNRITALIYKNCMKELGETNV